MVLRIVRERGPLDTWLVTRREGEFVRIDRVKFEDVEKKDAPRKNFEEQVKRFDEKLLQVLFNVLVSVTTTIIILHAAGLVF